MKRKKNQHPADIHIHAVNEAGAKQIFDSVYEQLSPRHPLSQRFHEILQGLGDLHDSKQIDYGRAKDPFANVRGSEDWGVRPWVGAMIRGYDKMKRLQNFAKTGTLANEGAEDSFRDLAVYAIIALVLWEEEEEQARTVRHVESDDPPDES